MFLSRTEKKTGIFSTKQTSSTFSIKNDVHTTVEFNIEYIIIIIRFLSNLGSRTVCCISFLGKNRTSLSLIQLILQLFLYTSQILKQKWQKCSTHCSKTIIFYKYFLNGARYKKYSNTFQFQRMHTFSTVEIKIQKCALFKKSVNQSFPYILKMKKDFTNILSVLKSVESAYYVVFFLNVCKNRIELIFFRAWKG